MMFENVVRADHLAKHLGVLLDDRRVGYRIDDASHIMPVRERMPQSEAQRGVRLAAAGGNRERENAWSIRCRFGTRVQNRATRLAEFGSRRVERLDHALEALVQCFERIGVQMLARRPLHEALRAEEVRIDQTREHHARQKGDREGIEMSHVVESDRFRLGQLDLASISAIVGKLAMLRFAKASYQRRSIRFGQ